jgi:hypothetical protein
MTRDSVKRRITKAIIEQTGSEYSFDIDTAMRTFWLDIRNEGGLRLTDVGDSFFKRADIEAFEFPFRLKRITDKEPIYSYQNLMLDLSLKVPCPYYIGRHKPNEPFIKIYDSKIAMMINLYGDIYEYLRNSQIRRK